MPHLETLCVLLEFIKGLEGASLDNDPILDNVRDRLWSPSTMFPHINDDLQMFICIFMEMINGSQSTYDSVCQFIKQQYPDAQTLTYDQMKRTLADLTGVVPVMTNMCSETCVAFTGPYSDLCSCPECLAPHYETIYWGNKLVTVPHRQALTIPIGSQIQAQY